MLLLATILIGCRFWCQEERIKPIPALPTNGGGCCYCCRTGPEWPHISPDWPVVKWRLPVLCHTNLDLEIPFWGPVINPLESGESTESHRPLDNEMHQQTRCIAEFDDIQFHSARRKHVFIHWLFQQPLGSHHSPSIISRCGSSTLYRCFLTFVSSFFPQEDATFSIPHFAAVVSVALFTTRRRYVVFFFNFVRLPSNFEHLIPSLLFPQSKFHSLFLVN